MAGSQLWLKSSKGRHGQRPKDVEILVIILISRKSMPWCKWPPWIRVNSRWCCGQMSTDPSETVGLQRRTMLLQMVKSWKYEWIWRVGLPLWFLASFVWRRNKKVAPTQLSRLHLQASLQVRPNLAQLKLSARPRFALFNIYKYTHIIGENYF